MAGELNDAELRLPSEFLADDFFLDKSGQDGSGGGVNGGGGECCFPTEFPYELGYDSNLSSPVESVTGTESSDEEDYMAGLTQQMAHYFLQDDEKGPVFARAAGNPKGLLTVGSPQSTLCALGSFKVSSRESSNGPSLVSSPPSTPLEPYKDDAWDLLYAAAGQVMRMRLNDEPEQQQQQQQHGGRGLLAPPPQKTSAPVPAALPRNAGGGYANLSLTQHQLRFSQYQQLKQQQMMKQQGAAAWSRQSRAKGGGTGGGLAGTRPTRPLGLSAAAWPPIQQQPSRSGMRAVFLNPASRRESCGTGVFLPRRVDNPTELRKKPACSTVLLPARVVQALNLNLDELGAHPRFPGAFALDQDAIIARTNAMLLQKRSYRHQPAPANLHHHRQQEVCLPSEWTY